MRVVKWDKLTEMNPAPLVYVIIPVYNREGYIEQCLSSVLRQTYPHVFAVCVDDGSTDSSLSILQEMAKKHDNVVVLSKENGGCSSARNAGLDYIKDKAGYFTFVDSDDWIEEDYCEHFMRITTEQACSVLKVGRQSNDIGILTKAEAMTALAKHELLYNPVRAFINIQSVRGLRFDESLTIGEDQLWNVSLFNRASRIFVTSDTTKYHWQHSKGSLTRSGMSNLRLLSQFFAWYKCLPFYKDNPALSIIRSNVLTDYLELCGKFDRKKASPESLLVYRRARREIRKNGLLKLEYCPRAQKKKYILYRYAKPFYRFAYRLALRCK